PRARDVRALGSAAVQSVRAFVALVTAAVAGRLDLRALSPLVVARDRDEIRSRLFRRAPHRVVGRTVETRLHTRVAGGSGRLVAGAHRRRTEDPRLARLLTQPPELGAVVEEDVVRVEPGEPGARGEPDAVCLREQPHPVLEPRHRPPVLRGEVTGAIDIDVVDA